MSTALRRNYSEVSPAHPRNRRNLRLKAAALSAGALLVYSNPMQVTLTAKAEEALREEFVRSPGRKPEEVVEEALADKLRSYGPTAIETVLLGTPPLLNTSGTASPAAVPGGTCALIW